MTTISKGLLVISVTGVLSGSMVDFGGFKMNPAWTVLLPFGAVAYGLFLISYMLESEAAKFDEDETKKAQFIS